ncbi:MAG TPA: YraN family protein [Kiritimatiellae bacterium]|nr:YraN family protein [Kiritimatiellia bacterium]
MPASWLPSVRSRAPHLSIGRWGERVAERELRRKGLKIIGRRVRVGRRDELDLIARDGQVLVFVEVKARCDERFGRPIHAVDKAKRRLLSRAAARYLRSLKNPPRFIRFDVVEVVGSPRDGVRPVVRHIAGAFSLDEHYRPCW